MKKCMKLVVIFMLQALVAFSLTAQAQDYDPDEARAQIRESSQVWASVGVTLDPTPLETLFADDFIGTDSQGRRYTKRDFINYIKSGPAPFEYNNVNEVKIRFFGNVAVAQGNENFKIKNGPAGRFYWTDVYVLRDGRWQIVAAQDMMGAPTDKVAEGDEKGLFNTDALSK